MNQIQIEEYIRRISGESNGENSEQCVKDFTDEMHKIIIAEVEGLENCENLRTSEEAKHLDDLKAQKQDLDTQKNELQSPMDDCSALQAKEGLECYAEKGAPVAKDMNKLSEKSTKTLMDYEAKLGEIDFLIVTCKIDLKYELYEREEKAKSDYEKCLFPENYPIKN